MKRTKVDLNCDMGESFGAWTLGNDRALMGVVSSVNIACGFHAGDASVIRRTIEFAIEKKVAIGAHPGYSDLQGFGRREMNLSSTEVYDIVLYQVAALKGMVEALGGRLHHVKPHGALYNRAARDAETAAAIVEAVRKIDSNLIFYGLANSLLIMEARKIGLNTASEVFADRTYQSNGTLTPRSQPNASIINAEAAVRQVLEMIIEGTVTAINNEKVPIAAETICIHGDGTHALEFAIAIRDKLIEKNITVEPLRSSSET